MYFKLHIGGNISNFECITRKSILGNINSVACRCWNNIFNM